MLHGFEPWRDFVNMNFPWLDLAPLRRAEFDACVSLRHFGNRSLASIISDDCRVIRQERAARRSDAGYLKVMWQRAGSMLVEQDKTSTRMQPGMATICDTARPYRLWMADDASIVVLTMPYSSVPGWERVSQKVCATELQDRTTVRAALAASLALLDAPDPCDPASSDSILQAVQWMMSASLHQMTSPEKASPGLKLDRAHQHILNHIDDPDLSPDELAAALHMSRRTLYDLFKEVEVTPSRYIRNLRLESVRQALTSPRNTNRNVFDIALDHGFTDSASFSRMFKSAFGMAPSEWRLRNAVGLVTTATQH